MPTGCEGRVCRSSCGFRTVWGGLGGGLAGWFVKTALGSGRRPGVARHASNFLSRRRKKVTKERATPSLRPLRVAKGQTCVGAVVGCAVELALRLRRAARTTMASQFTKHGRFDAHAPPQPPRRRRRPQGGGCRTPQQPPAPLPRPAPARGRKRLARRRRGRAQQWPVWMSDSRVPFCMRLGRAGRGVAWASERACFVNCLTAAVRAERRRRAASSAVHPVTEHPRLPRSAAQGSQTAGSPFLWFLSFGDAKERDSPAGAPPRPPPPPQARRPHRSTSFPRLRQAQPERAGVIRTAKTIAANA